MFDGPIDAEGPTSSNAISKVNAEFVIRAVCSDSPIDRESCGVLGQAQFRRVLPDSNMKSGVRQWLGELTLGEFCTITCPDSFGKNARCGLRAATEFVWSTFDPKFGYQLVFPRFPEPVPAGTGPRNR